MKSKPQEGSAPGRHHRAIGQGLQATEALQQWLRRRLQRRMLPAERDQWHQMADQMAVPPAVPRPPAAAPAVPRPPAVPRQTAMPPPPPKATRQQCNVRHQAQRGGWHEGVDAWPRESVSPRTWEAVGLFEQGPQQAAAMQMAHVVSLGRSASNARCVRNQRLSCRTDENLHSVSAASASSSASANSCNGNNGCSVGVAPPRVRRSTAAGNPIDVEVGERLRKDHPDSKRVSRGTLDFARRVASKRAMLRPHDECVARRIENRQMCPIARSWQRRRNRQFSGLGHCHAATSLLA